MAHHKRRRPKSQRAGCSCKIHKFEQWPKSARFKGIRGPRLVRVVDKLLRDT